MNPKSTTDTDQDVGSRVALLRKTKGLSQTALGNAIGVTFQQVQKYEKGSNRIGASRLQLIAKILNVPLASFFDDNDTDTSQQESLFFLTTPGAVELMRAYASIEDADLRRDLLAIVRTATRMKL